MTYTTYKTGKMLRSIGCRKVNNYYHARMKRAARIRRAHDIIGYAVCGLAVAGFVGTFVFYKLFM